MVFYKKLSNFYHLETADIMCEQFNKFVNTLKKEKEESKQKYPWLGKNEEMKYMTEKYKKSMLIWKIHA